MDETSSGGWSGIFQSIASTATGYLDRRIDIDLQSRLVKAQLPERLSDQTRIYQTVPNQVLGMNLSALLPLLLVAGVALVVLRK